MSDTRIVSSRRKQRNEWAQQIMEYFAFMPQGTMTAQVEMILSSLVACGVLQPEDRIPSAQALSEYLGCEPTTIITAYRNLQEQQILHSVLKSGTYIAADQHALIAVAKNRIMEVVTILRQLSMDHSDVLHLWETLLTFLDAQPPPPVAIMADEVSINIAYAGLQAMRILMENRVGRFPGKSAMSYVACLRGSQLLLECWQMRLPQHEIIALIKLECQRQFQNKADRRATRVKTIRGEISAKKQPVPNQ